MFFKLKPSIFITLISLLFTSIILAGVLSNPSSPTPTSYTLEDIYNLVENDITPIEGNHSLQPTVGSTTPTMYSVSDIYVVLANKINADHLAPGVRYLGVTGGEATPAPLAFIPKEFNPTSAPGTVTGYTLFDIKNLIENNIRLTSPNTTYGPSTTPTPSVDMFTFTDIYTSISTLIDPADIASGQSYLGVTGTFIPLLDYTLTYHANSGSGAPDSVILQEQSTTTLAATTPTRVGYTFVSWNTASDGSGDTYAPDTSFTMPASDTTLYAIWQVNSYTLTYNANGGSGAPSSESRDYNIEQALSSTVPTRSGYTFVSWNTESSGDGTSYNPNDLFIMPASNTTLYAVWQLNSYTLTYNANGGSGAPDSETPVYGSTVTVSSVTPTQLGYTFVSWNTEQNGNGITYNPNDLFIMPAEAVILYAQWSVISYTLSYNPNGGNGESSSETRDYNSTQALSSTVPTRSGYTFTAWNTESNGTGTDYGSGANYTMPASDTTLYAKWQANFYTLSYDANGGSGEISSESRPYESTSALSPNIPTRIGYTFSSWNTLSNGTGTNYAPSASFTMPAYDVTLYAQWSLVSYTLSFNSNGGSAVSSITQEYGTTITAPANPTRSGYTFAGWSPAIPATMPAGNQTHTAQWTANPTYTLTYNGNGNISGTAPTDANSPYEAGETVTVATVGTLVKTGYTFAGWNTNSSGTGTNYVPSASFTMPAANTTLWAKWNVNSYTLTYNANVGTGAPGSQSREYNSTSALSSTIPTRTGYIFVSWNTNSSGTGTNYASGANYTMPAANTTLWAKWSDNSWCTQNSGIVLPFDASLCWQKDVSLSTRNWTNGGAYCSGLTFGGLTWRLPTMNELGCYYPGCFGSLLWWMNEQRGYSQITYEYGRNYGTWLNNNKGFSNFRDSKYWTSEDYGSHSLIVDFNNGENVQYPKTNGIYYAVCVSRKP